MWWNSPNFIAYLAGGVGKPSLMGGRRTVGGSGRRLPDPPTARRPPSIVRPSGKTDNIGARGLPIGAERSVGRGVLAQLDRQPAGVADHRLQAGERERRRGLVDDLDPE